MNVFMERTSEAYVTENIISYFALIHVGTYFEYSTNHNVHFLQVHFSIINPFCSNIWQITKEQKNFVPVIQILPFKCTSHMRQL